MASTPRFWSFKTHEGDVGVVPAEPGRRGVVKYTDQTAAGTVPEGTPVEVIAEVKDSHSVLAKLPDGSEIEMGRRHIDCGRMLFIEGQWRPIEDPLCVEWMRRDKERKAARMTFTDYSFKAFRRDTGLFFTGKVKGPPESKPVLTRGPDRPSC